MAENEETEFWRTWRSEKQDMRRYRAKSNMQILGSTNVRFRSNTEHHLTLYLGEDRIDFWPSTGRWYNAQSRRRGFGLSDLFKIYGVTSRE